MTKSMTLRQVIEFLENLIAFQSDYDMYCDNFNSKLIEIVADRVRGSNNRISLKLITEAVND